MKKKEKKTEEKVEKKVETKKEKLVPNPNLKINIHVHKGEFVITDLNQSANDFTGSDWNEIQKALKKIFFV